jgi:hypothetical protein
MWRKRYENAGKKEGKKKYFFYKKKLVKTWKLITFLKKLLCLEILDTFEPRK